MSRLMNPVDYDILADVTNGADTTFTYDIPSLDSFSKVAIQLALSCTAGTVTATIEGSVESDVDKDSATYEDMTNEVFGVMSLVASAGSASDIWIDDIGALGMCKYARVKIVAATGATTGDWKISIKKKVL